MVSAKLNTYTTKKFTWERNFDKIENLTISGFDEVDTDYTLTFTNGTDNVLFNVGNGKIVVNSTDKTLTLMFSGDEFNQDEYTGVLESTSKEADKYLMLEITLKNL